MDTAPFRHAHFIHQLQKRGCIAQHNSHLAGKGGEPAEDEGFLMAPGSRQALCAHPFLFPAWQTLPLAPAPRVPVPSERVSASGRSTRFVPDPTQAGRGSKRGGFGERGLHRNGSWLPSTSLHRHAAGAPSSHTT